MAIAPLPDLELLEAPWPRPTLRLVETFEGSGFGDEDPQVRVGHRSVEFAGDAGEDEERFVSAGPETVGRRDIRTSARVRRRRLTLGALVVGLLIALAVPLSALGGQPISASPAVTGGAQVHGEVYVVQPGDTLWSIASRVDGGGDPRALAEALAVQLGSSTVVPGEHVVIP